MHSWNAAKRKRANLLKIKAMVLFCWLLPVFLAGQPAPKRVVSLAPHATEIIFRLGARDLLVGRSDFCLYPPSAEAIPGVGGYLNPDLEKIVALQPDVVFVFPNAEMSRKLQRVHLNPVPVPNETIAQIQDGIKKVGEILQRPAQAAAIIAGIRDTLEWVQSHSANWPRRTALLLIGREAGSLRQLYAAGKDTYLSELLNLCHYENVMSDVDIRYFEVSKEDLLRRDPDVILEFRLLDSSENRAAALASFKADWQVLPTLKAVRQGNIFIFTERYFLIPGPRVARAAVTLFNVLGRSEP